MKKIQDFYFKKAKEEGYPARSVYKLQEAQDKYHFMKKGQKILDLGAAPGSWTKYACQITQKKGKVVAVDIKDISFSAPNLHFLKEDVFQLAPEMLLKKYGAFDIVLSDMAPKTSGRKDVDHLKSISLAETARYIASKVLKPNGSFYVKIFQGSDFPAFKKECAALFRRVKVIKPKSSRKESVEIFLLCTQKITKSPVIQP